MFRRFSPLIAVERRNEMTLNQLLKPIARLKSKEFSPSQAWSMYQVDALVSDHHSSNDFRISVDGGSVWLTQQPSGENSRRQIQIPRQEFNKMIQWYTKPQRLRTAKQIIRSVIRIAAEMKQSKTD